MGDSVLEQMFGSAVKSISEDNPYIIRGRAVVFGGRDLVNDYFTKNTDFGSRTHVGMGVYYDHAMGDSIRGQIGWVKEWIPDDDGIDVVIELDRRKSYIKDILELVKMGALGLSTAAVGNLVVREQGQIKRWITGELSLTPTPAEPRTSVSAKAIGDDSQDSVAQTSDIQSGSDFNSEKEIQMSDLHDAVKDVLYNMAGEPVKGGGIVMPDEDATKKAPAHNKLPKTNSENELKAAQLHWLRTGRQNDAMKATIAEDSGTWSVAVAHDLQRDIVGKRDEMSILSQVPVRRVTTGKEYYDVNTENAKASFGFVAELGAANQSEPTATQRSIRLYKASLMMKISNEILEDTSNNLEAYLTDAIARAYAVNINTYLLGGSGSSQPQGIIPRISNSVTLTSTTGVSVANVNDIFYGLPQAYHGNETAWAMRIATLGAIRALTVSGAFAFQETPVGTTDGMERLKYRPVVMSDGVSALGASNKSIIFGNWSYAYFVEHSGGLKISRNPYLYEATGETAIFVTARWGSDLVIPEAFIRGTNPAS